MRLSLKMICERLEALPQFHILKFKDIYSTLRLRRPLFLTDETAVLAADTLYIAKEEKLPADLVWEDGAALIFAGSAQTDILHHPAVILVDTNTDLLQLHNQICRIFDLFDTWEEALKAGKTGTNSHAVIQTYLLASRNVLDNPAGIMDSAGHCLTSQEASFLPPDFEQTFLSLCAGQRLEKETHSMADPKLPWRVIVKPLSADKDVPYYLFAAEASRPFRETDYLLLEILGNYIEQVVKTPAAAVEEPLQGLADLLKKVLTGGIWNKASVQAQLKRLGWSTSGHFAILCAGAAGSDAPFSLLAGPFFKNPYPPEQAAFFHLQSMFCWLVNLEKISADAPQTDCPAQEWSDLFKEQAFPMLETRQLTGGLSNAFENIYDAPIYYRQAQIALTFCQNQDTDTPLLSFRDCALSFMIHAAVSEFPKEELLAPAYIRLKEHDRKNHTEYLKTLHEYIRQNLNAVQTAQALFMHRATIIYRIRRICEIGRTDLKEPDELLHLALSFRLDAGE